MASSVNSPVSPERQKKLAAWIWNGVCTGPEASSLTVNVRAAAALYTPLVGLLTAATCDTAA